MNEQAFFITGIKIKIMLIGMYSTICSIAPPPLLTSATTGMFLRFSYDEMLCMSEAIESGQDFCPSPMIIEQLDACLKESEEGKLQAPSESDLPPGAVVCR